jgi:hypothetical protein
LVTIYTQDFLPPLQRKGSMLRRYFTTAAQIIYAMNFIAKDRKATGIKAQNDAMTSFSLRLAIAIVCSGSRAG